MGEARYVNTFTFVHQGHRGNPTSAIEGVNLCALTHGVISMQNSTVRRRISDNILVCADPGHLPADQPTLPCQGQDRHPRIPGKILCSRIHHALQQSSLPWIQLCGGDIQLLISPDAKISIISVAWTVAFQHAVPAAIPGVVGDSCKDVLQGIRTLVAELAEPPVVVGGNRTLPYLVSPPLILVTSLYLTSFQKT